MPTKIQVRRDTAANWTSVDPTLDSGEIGFETDTGKFKIGDGTTVWASLAYFGTNELTADELAAINGAATPSGSNVFATIADLPANELSTDQLAAITGASSPSATNTFLTVSASREKLTANRTYYVATTGSDSNDGLTVGNPFLTIQKAVDVIHDTLDLCGWQAKIQLANGTYSAGANILGMCVGQEAASNLYILGDTTTPSNVHISLSTGTAFYVSSGARCRIRGLKISGQTGYAIDCVTHSQVEYGNIEFGAAGTGGGHIEVWKSAVVECLWNSSISGGGLMHWHVAERGQLQCVGITYTLSNTPAFSAYFIGLAVGNGFMVSTTFTGTGATGPRYLCYKNSVLDTGGGGANYFPGNVAGTTATGGQYI